LRLSVGGEDSNRDATGHGEENRALGDGRLRAAGPWFLNWGARAPPRLGYCPWDRVL